MKKLSKILVLLLSLVAIVTAFTVVALADETTGRGAPVVALDVDFSNKKDGDTVSNSTDKLGKWTVSASEDQNKYLVGSYDSAGSSEQNLDISFNATWSVRDLFGAPLFDTTEYGVYGVETEYPIYAFDFDVMSPTGLYTGDKYSAAIRFDLYGVKVSDGKGSRIAQMTSCRFYDFKLSSVPYEWQHVTMLTSHIGNGVFETRFFVNGKETKTAIKNDYGATIFDKDGKNIYTNLRVAYMSIRPTMDSANEGTENESKFCMDNLKCSYYPAGYSAEEVANYIYNDTYKLPYGKTVASIIENEVETKYDNFAEAYAAANKNNVLKLYTDATCEINKAMVVDAGEFAFNWTSEKFVDVNEEEKIYQFSLAEDYYDGKFTDQSGNVTYFKGYKEFEEAVQSVIDNADWANREKMNTIVLYSNLEYYKSFSAKKAYTKLTIDLNGHTLTAALHTGSVYKDDGAGNYVEQVARTNTSTVFTSPVNTGSTTFNVISSSGRGIFNAYSVTGDAYYDSNDKLVKYENASVNKSAFINAYNSGNHSFNLENIDIYAENIFSAAANGFKSTDLTVKNCRFYKTVGSSDTAAYNKDTDGGKGCISVSSTNGDNITLTVTDSLFYIPDATVKAGNAYYTFITIGSANKTHTATFTNCDIISYNNAYLGVWEAASADPATNTSSVIFNDCRIYGIQKIPRTNGDVYNPTVGAGTISSSAMVADGNADLADGCVSIDKLQSISYLLPNVSKVSIDSNGKAALDFEFANKEVTFTKKVGLASNLAEVKWLDLDGNVLATSQEFKGDTASIPASIAEIEKFPSGNGYTAFTNDPVWRNAENGTELTVLGDSISFTATLPENPQYVANVTEFLFSMSYMDMIKYILYVPVVDGVEVFHLGDYSSESTGNFKIVKIDGKEYYAAPAQYRAITNSIYDLTSSVNFRIGEAEYEQKVDLSIQVYAKALWATPGVADCEKDAILKLMAYVEQARRYAFGESSHNTDQKIFDPFFGTYFNTENPNARPAYVENTQTVYDIDEAFDKYVVSLQYGLHESGRVSFGVTMDKGYLDHKLDLYYSNGDRIGFSKTLVAATDENGNALSYTYYTRDRAFDALFNDCVINIKDASGNIVATQSYNLATYKSGMVTDEAKDLADAMYTFGKAIEEVRAYLNSL